MKTMISNIILFIGGAFVGVMILSCLSVNTVNDERERAYRRGFERGKSFGRNEERGKKRD